MAKLKRIGILFLAKFQAIVMAMVGLILGVLYSFGGFFYEISTDTLNTGTALAFLALIGMPLALSLVGFLAGIAEAILYNIFARLVGGIDADFSTE